jgi:putative salt-induced outer membrane protein YdiY
MRTRWSAFTRSQLEYDQFKAFDLRVGLNAGLAYKLVETESTNWKTRFGAGASREFGGPDDFWKPEAVFGFDLKYQLTKRQTLETTVDYFPTWEDFSDYRLVTNSGWQVVLDEASNLSLKIGVIDRYDSTPNGRRPNDIDYSILLLWKI